MARFQSTQRGMKESSWSGLRYEACGCQVPSVGLWMCQLLAIPCVASSLALVALGGSEPIGRFHLQILSIGRPTAIVWPILDTVTVSLSVEGVVCEEQEGRVNVYNVLYYVLQGSEVSLPRFLTLWGLENS
jgi:hypothetical protein